MLIENCFCGFWLWSLSLSEKGLVSLKIVSLPMLIETLFSGPLDAMLDETSEARDLNDIGDGKGL